jgi:hypothetical protein
MTGAILGIGRLMLGFTRLLIIARQADPASGHVATMLKDLSQDCGIVCPVKGLISREPISPMTWGWYRPVVMLPYEALGWSAERLRLVLLHELAHVQRSDFASQLAGEVARAIYWFHPLAWWILRCLRVEQEAACDDRVLASGQNASNYAEELLSITARIPHGYRETGFAPTMSRAKRIEKRVRAILETDRRRNEPRPWDRMSITCLFATIATITAIIGPKANAENIPSGSTSAHTTATHTGKTASQNAHDSSPQDAPEEGDEPTVDDAMARLKDIATGKSHAPTREDLPLVLLALKDRDLNLRGDACLAVEKMALLNLLVRDDLRVLWDLLKPNLQSPNQDTSEWAVRAAAAMIGAPDLSRSPFWSNQEWTLERDPSEADRLAGELLEEVFKENLQLLGSSDRELQRRGANLSRYLMERLPQPMQERLIRSLLDIPLATPIATDPQSPEVRCNRQVTNALAHGSPFIQTNPLASDVANRLLEASNDFEVAMNDGVYSGLAHLADNTQGDLRMRIVQKMLAAVADGRLSYSRTSGIATPPKHIGADALTILAPGLTGDELVLAQKAIPPQPEGSREAYDSMYKEAIASLATRKQLLESKPQPPVRQEEDLAFFEKRYKKKFSEVKPKDEYPDPDLFYSAIAKELGISEIAWKAAAEKFGWKKEDGRNTFAMLKGGPTSEGGEGTWDVLFIRSTMNPETKRPDPATIEQVMVQIDYDGKISYPKIP